MPMKRQTIIKVVCLSATFALMAGSGLAIIAHPTELIEAKGYTTSTLTKTIDLNDSSEQDIRNYYSSLNSLSESERQGTNLLKNLKPILKNGQKYYSYDTDSNGRKIWQIYEIADRDWIKSPASEIDGYNASTNTISNYTYGTSYTSGNTGTNPYIHALYVNRDVDNNVRAWALTGTNTTSHGGNNKWCIDREHIWQKSQGFNADGAGGARGDPMHLWPGDSDVNSSLHNDQFYGFVNITSSTKTGKHEYARDNYVGDSLTLGAAGSANYVFEPQDCDKGDIARAIFYMVARYNNLSGSDSDGIDSNNPNLALAQINVLPAAYTSTATETGKMGVLTDLLDWHHLDPVDEFEIHRNNLLYKNYTNNRNPFIDFPEWVDYIWGTATYNGRNYQSYDSTPQGSANPASDPINAFVPDDVDKVVEKIEVTSMPTNTTCYVGESFNKAGLVVTATYEDNTTANVTNLCTYTVDTSTVGTKTVTVTYGEKTTTFEITVIEKPAEEEKRNSIFDTIPWWVWIIVAVVVIAVIVGIACGVLKVNKKGKIKVNKSGVKKIAKGSKKKK